MDLLLRLDGVAEALRPPAAAAAVAELELELRALAPPLPLPPLPKKLRPMRVAPRLEVLARWLELRGGGGRMIGGVTGAARGAGAAAAPVGAAAAAAAASELLGCFSSACALPLTLSFSLFFSSALLLSVALVCAAGVWLLPRPSMAASRAAAVAAESPPLAPAPPPAPRAPAG